VTSVLQGGDEAKLKEIDIVQPVLFAISVALAAHWRSWGIEPDGVIGHSMGEVAAACVAGALSLEDAAAVIARRSRLMKRVRGTGSMALVELSMAELETWLTPFGEKVSIGASNGDSSTVISGETRAVETLLTQFETAGVFARQIKVDVASHSSQVDPLLDDLFESLQTLRPGVGTIPMYSTVRSRVEFGEALDARYWVDNLRQRVLFAPGIRQMLDSGFDTFVEISGHPLLLNAIEGMLASSNTTGLAIGSLRRETSEIATLLESLGALHCFGQSVDWARQYPAGTCVSLATYPFQRERLWPELVEKQTLRRVEHRLLGRRVDSSANPDTVLFENEISGESPAYLADHIVRDQIVLPASGHCEMALAAAGALFGEGPVTLQDVEIQKAVVLPAKETRKVQLVGHRQGPDRVQFEIRAMEDDGTWALCSHGLLLRGAKEAAAQTLEQARDRCQNEISVAAFYQGLAEAGLPYGAAFQAVQEIWEGESEFLSRIQLRTETDKERFHPAMLDGGLQAVVHGAMDWSGDERTWVPIGIRRLCFYADSADKQLFAHFAPAQPSVDDGTFGGNLEFYSADGKLVAAVEEIRFRRLAADDPGRNCLHQTVWEPLAALPQQPLSQQTTGGACIVLGDAPELLHALRSAGKQFRTVATSEAADLDRLFSEPEVRNATAIVYTSSQREVFGDSLPGICTTPVRLLQALLRAGLPQSPRLWMVTTGTQDPDGTSQTIAVEQAPLWGLGRVIALEHPEYQPSTVDLSPSPTAKEYAQLVRLIDAQPSEDEIAIRGDRYFVARLDTWDAPAKAMPKAAAYRVAPSQPGVLDSLELEAISDAPPGSGEVQVNVRAAGINFHDVLGALGLVADGPNGVLTLGMEFAGEVDCVGDAVKGTAPGDRVFGVASPYRTSTLASQVTVPATYVRPMPLAWDFETAGSQPIVFLTAWYGLHELARLKKGERVLIHSGAGGVGMAAIQIALRAGAEVYATAGNEEKREFLRRLGVKHVFDSRSLGFADEIWAASAGAGVHVVLNSLAGGFLERSLELLAPYGRFVELGKRDVGENRSLGLSQFGRNISFFVVDLADMLERRSEWIAGALDDICALFAAGEISPLPVTSFEAADAALIFQNMARGQHIGKLALKFSGPASLAATDEFLFRADATYLITGGMGGIGLEVARWLADKGARHVALAGRRGPSAAASHQIEALRARGVRVATHLADISQEGDVRRVIAEIDGSGAPLRGVFHAAAVVRDQLLRDLDTESTEAVFSPKVKGAWHLHQATLHRDLDCFVLFSSIAAILPQPGHGSYSAANSFLDALARLRKKQGLPALSVNWGGWRGVGLASLEGTQRTLRGCARRGVPSMTAASALDALNHALRGEQANLLISPIHASRLTRAYDGEAMPAVLRRLATSAPAETANLQSSLLSELMHAQSGPERREMLEEHLKEQASRVLRLSAARIQRTRPLGQMGLDSLMSVEYVNRLRATLSLPLAGTTVFNYPTIAKLADHIARRLDISLEDQATCSDTIPETAPKIPDSIDELSEEQALEMLMSGDWRP
jgi:acyl transferase domain-containing protein/acyl carrier protein